MKPRMAPGVFVTGTDTGVGKTLCAQALIRAAVAAGGRAAGMKPVASGAQWLQGRWVSEDAQALRAAASVELPDDLLNPYCLPEAVSPHIAAQQAGIRIDIETIVASFTEILQLSDIIVVEGAGGWLVPLTPGVTMADLAGRLGLPVVLVVGLRLGCLNHALLTAESIAAHGQRLAGWIGNHIDPQFAAPDQNLATLRAALGAPLAVIPHAAPAGEAVAQLLASRARWLDAC